MPKGTKTAPLVNEQDFTTYCNICHTRITAGNQPNSTRMLLKLRLHLKGSHDLIMTMKELRGEEQRALIMPSEVTLKGQHQTEAEHQEEIRNAIRLLQSLK
jgi:hypothetical protein